MKRPCAKKELGILTVIFGDSSIDSVGLSVKCDVLDTKILPVSQQANQLLPNLAAAKLEAQYLARRFDVEKAGNPV